MLPCLPITCCLLLLLSLFGQEDPQVPCNFTWQNIASQPTLTGGLDFVHPPVKKDWLFYSIFWCVICRNQLQNDFNIIASTVYTEHQCSLAAKSSSSRARPRRQKRRNKLLSDHNCLLRGTSNLDAMTRVASTLSTPLLSILCSYLPGRISFCYYCVHSHTSCPGGLNDGNSPRSDSALAGPKKALPRKQSSYRLLEKVW